MFSKVIITGVNGWLGNGLLDFLKSKLKDHESIFYDLKIIGFDQKKTENKNAQIDGIEYIEGDLRSKRDIENLVKDSEDALIINLAGIIHPNTLKQSDFNLINNISVSNLAKAAKSAGVKKFIAMSSNSPCGYSKDNSIIFDEESNYRPYMGYGVSKMNMEKNILKISDNNKNTNFSIIRSPWFYGPNQPERQTSFFKMIRNGTFPILGKGQNLRSMAYIDNICDGILRVASYFDSNGEIFWIADEHPYKMIEIVNIIKKIMSKDFGLDVSSKQIYLPKITSDFARYADGILQKLGFYNQKIHVLSEMNQTIACDISKSKNLLNYHPKVSLEDGMKKSIAWCLDNNLGI